MNRNSPYARFFICTYILLSNLPADHISSITPILLLISFALAPSSVLFSKSSRSISFTSFSVLSLSTSISCGSIRGIWTGGAGGNAAGIGGRFTGGMATGLAVAFDKGNATLLFKMFRGLFGVACGL